MPRAIARKVQVRQAELREPVPKRLEGRLGQAQVGLDVQVRDECRLLVDRDEAATARLARRVDGARATPDGDRAAVRADGAGQDLDEGALARAVRAHEGVNLAGANRQRGRFQGDDSAVRLGNAGRLEHEVRGRDGHGRPGVRCGRGDAGEPASPGISCRNESVVRTLAGDGLFRGVVGVALDLETERPARVETFDEPRLELGLALVGLVIRQDRVEQDGIRLSGRSGRPRPFHRSGA